MEPFQYLIDASSSRFTIRAYASGMFSALGHNPVIAIRDFTGEVRFLPEDFREASLTLRIGSASLSVQNEISEGDRRKIEQTMKEEVLETARYPEIVFKSTDVSVSKAAQGLFAVNMIGNLSLHGVDRSQPVSAQVSADDNGLRASGEFSMLQTKFNIKPVSVAGGTLKLKDELKLSFDVQARRRK